MELNKTFCNHWVDCKLMGSCELTLTERVVDYLKEKFAIQEKDIKTYKKRPPCFSQRRDWE